ncbi:Crp/Fnr family transcriptional regulator [Ensifer aridi]|uniref:Crp/Fnr family transcriptional regulator n=1 Tax=Ensifer aridi TaxID=1708715 RepID=UPI000A112AC5|nr:Crp/Fnr family transcriptional regulator [Ensifer aridi]
MRTLRLTLNDRTMLLGSRFFVGLPRSTGEAILEDVTVSTHKERDLLFHQDENVDEVFWVLSGLIRLYRVGKDGREADLAILPMGEMFAESAMFLGHRATASAQAAQASIVARLDSRKLRHLVSDPDVAQAFINLLCHRAKMTEDILAQDRLLTGIQRVASYILSQCPAGSTNFSFRLPFQKNVLAGKLGLAPEGLSRAFSTLRQAGVTVNGKTIEIRDRHALEQFQCGG